MILAFIFFQFIYPSKGIFSVPKHHETPYVDEKYTTPFEKNSTNGTLLEKITYLNKLAHKLVNKLTIDIENCTSKEFVGFQDDLDLLHDKLEEFHFIESNKTENSVWSNKTASLYLDTINTVIKFNEIVTRLI